MYRVCLVIYLVVAISLVILIILQQNKNGNIGSSLNTGASSTFFGSSGSGGFLSRLISCLAALFFVLSLILSNLSNKRNLSDSQWDKLDQRYRTYKSQVQNITNPSNDIPQ